MIRFVSSVSDEAIEKDAQASLLPPPVEQCRVVAKVDTLLALCDRVKASLTATATAADRHCLPRVRDRELEAAE